MAGLAGLAGLSACSVLQSWGWQDSDQPWQASPSVLAAQEQAESQAQEAAAATAPESMPSDRDAAAPTISDGQSPFVSSDSPASSAGVARPGALPSAYPMASGRLHAEQSVRPMDAAGNTPANWRQITFSHEGIDFDPDIDPTGQYLVFASTRHRSTSAIYLQKVDAVAVTQLTGDPSNNAMPAFSPDGKRIAFASDRTGNWDIFTMSLDGGPAVQITSDATADIHPRFSPDGRWLLYTTLSVQSGQWEMVLVDLEKPGIKRFLGQGVFPSWSPRGDRIVFQKAKQRGTRWFSLWTVDLVNGEAVRPTEIVSSANAACITPRFSPDGQKLVFVTVVDPDAQAAHGDLPMRADIHLVSLDGSNRMNLTQSRTANLQPVWASDDTIYFVSRQTPGGLAAKENIWAMRSDRMTAPGSSGSGKANVVESPRSSGR